MSALPTLAFLLIILSAIVQAVFLFRKERAADPVSHWLAGLAALLLAAVIATRSVEIGFPALTGTFESLVFYALVLCALTLAYRLQRGLPFLPLVQFGATLAALALLAVSSSPLAPRETLAPIPALRSGWLVAHVALSFVGEAFFVASFVASVAYLSVHDVEKRRDYDRISYTSVAVGYPVFTVGALIFGAIWAERAWGSWWSWDPKETWALVTWLVYTLYLHLRLIRRGERADAGSLPAVVAVAGFLCTVFTFFGVNFLLTGLHSYG
ncbi:MAG TPA: cytochrome c biogenesis protein CcsA [Rectinemataceae bacterium]|nr:cytochrome c biogenesis protein CcsA [Rectinemataceae bacterium]